MPTTTLEEHHKWEDEADIRRSMNTQIPKHLRGELRAFCYQQYIDGVLPPEIARRASKWLKEHGHDRDLHWRTVYTYLSKHVGMIRAARDPLEDFQVHNDRQAMIGGKAIKAAQKLEEAGSEDSPQYAALLNAASSAFEKQGRAQGLFFNNKPQDVNVTFDLGASIREVMERRNRELEDSHGTNPAEIIDGTILRELPTPTES